MTYRSFDSLFGNVLQENDQIEMVDSICVVSRNILVSMSPNDVFFTKLGIDKYQFCDKYYGYPCDRDGTWPGSKTTDGGDKEALTRCVLGLFAMVEGRVYEPGDEIKKTSKKKEPINFKPLDKLVIDEKVKNEIISVLKQQDNAIKIFEEWGLGELIEYGKGMTFMFHGKPGTGKTYAAQLIAKCFGQELLILGAAEIQTSEPGGANRNIQNAFKTAKQGKGKVLFLDECDSLITSRQNVGMIIGSEINTLLTEIERFEGVCILATNRIGFMDEALHRRISLIVEFPEPNFDARLMIWNKLLPPKMPLEKKVKVETLAEYKLTGGLIKNVILQAARLACANESLKVGLTDFETAIARTLTTKNLMGKDDRTRARMERVEGDISTRRASDKIMSS